jgi:hypothetical protein
VGLSNDEEAYFAGSEYPGFLRVAIRNPIGLKGRSNKAQGRAQRRPGIVKKIF